MTRLAQDRERTGAPWQLSEAPQPGEATRVNVPTDDGRALGVQLARLCDIEEARQLKQFPTMLPRCNECAFRAGTLPNGCPETLMDAIKCAIERDPPFYCHKGLREGEPPRRLCTGWMVMQSADPPIEFTVSP